MNVNSVNYTGYAASTTVQTNGKGDTSVTEEALSCQYSATTVNTDTFVRSEEHTEDTGAITYTPPKKLTSEQVEALKRQVQESMQALAEKMLNAQSEIAKKDDGSIDYMALAKSLGIGTTPETAAEAISEDGMWGVNAVATRLMDMALALSNGDSSMAEELRAAVQKGFEAVGDIESLPQVCQDTYAEVMKRFDYWEANGTMDGYVYKSEEEAGSVTAE